MTRRTYDKFPAIDVFVGNKCAWSGWGAVAGDMSRWEEQKRQRRNLVSNLGVSNSPLKASLQYKRSFFVDWRVCDRLKSETLSRWDYLLDTTMPALPKLVGGEALRRGLSHCAS